MLVLTRRKNQKVLFPNLGITVEVVDFKGKTVRLGVVAPRDVRIVRNEIGCIESDRITLSLSDGKCIEQIRRQLDAANLAIHLARNQLQQGKAGLAGDAVGHAIDCLRSLESLLGSNDPDVSCEPESPIAVHEPRTAYQQSAPQLAGKGTALVFGGELDQRQKLVRHLMQRNDLEVITQSDGLATIRYLKEHNQPVTVIAVGAWNPSLQGEQLPLDLPGIPGLQMRLEPVTLGGVETTVWCSPEFDRDNPACQLIDPASEPVRYKKTSPAV